MPKCSYSPVHNRVLKRGDSHYSGSKHKSGIRGCSWKGKGMNRVCARCHRKPRGSTELIGRSDPYYTLTPKQKEAALAAKS